MKLSEITNDMFPIFKERLRETFKEAFGKDFIDGVQLEPTEEMFVAIYSRAFASGTVKATKYFQEKGFITVENDMLQGLMSGEGFSMPYDMPN